MYEKLSEAEGLGQVALCQNCDDVHVSVGNMAFRLPRGAFHDLCRLLNEAAVHPLIQEEPCERLYSVSFEDGRPRFKFAGKS